MKPGGGANTTVELIKACDEKRKRSIKFQKFNRTITVGQLRKEGGTDYKFFRNNCYHARNRMLSYLGIDVRNCPNPYRDFDIETPWGNGNQ